jgi:ketopantoate reductase
MRIAIYGTGGAGGYFGALLARSGEDVTFIARGQHLKAIQAHGLCVETPAGEIVIKPAKKCLICIKKMVPRFLFRWGSAERGVYR